MPASPLIDRRRLDFVLHELCNVQSLLRLPRFAAHDRTSIDAVVDAAHALAVSHFLPHNHAADADEPRLVDGRVRLVDGVAAALAAHAQAGFPAMLADADDGGMQLPYMVALACDGLFAGANVATSGYALLARGVANLLVNFGSTDQRARFVPALLAGRWFGTMCLSEPQAGSSLGDIRTLAQPHADGTWRVRGSKMWISGGEHELGDNIVHMVLARTPGAPAGVRGLSLFVVPRYRVDADGSRGEANDVRLIGLNHKLGQRGIVNTVLAFGEAGDCRGELLGREGEGLAQMFQLMNEARLGVGMGAVMLASAGYRASLDYARERRQGRLPGEKDPASAPVPILAHADVRRMLLRQKAISEGAFALALQAACWVDEHAHAADADARREAGLLLDLLTPVVKAWSAQWGCVANDLAIQVLGGYGYTREFPVEQLWRDNRLNPIHEGTNGIQALDLLGRKLPMAGGAGWRALRARIDVAIGAARTHASLRGLADELASFAALVDDTLGVVLGRLGAGAVNEALAQASPVLDLVGHLCIGWTWLRMATLAQHALDRGAADAAFHRGTVAACRHFLRHELPPVAALAPRVRELDTGMLAIADDEF